MNRFFLVFLPVWHHKLQKWHLSRKQNQNADSLEEEGIGKICMFWNSVLQHTLGSLFDSSLATGARVAAEVLTCGSGFTNSQVKHP